MKYVELVRNNMNSEHSKVGKVVKKNLGFINVLFKKAGMSDEKIDKVRNHILIYPMSKENREKFLEDNNISVFDLEIDKLCYEEENILNDYKVDYIAELIYGLEISNEKLQHLNELRKECENTHRDFEVEAIEYIGKQLNIPTSKVDKYLKEFKKNRKNGISKSPIDKNQLSSFIKVKKAILGDDSLYILEKVYFASSNISYASKSELGNNLAFKEILGELTESDEILLEAFKVANGNEKIAKAYINARVGNASEQDVELLDYVVNHFDNNIE